MYCVMRSRSASTTGMGAATCSGVRSGVRARLRVVRKVGAGWEGCGFG